MVLRALYNREFNFKYSELFEKRIWMTFYGNVNMVGEGVTDEETIVVHTRNEVSSKMVSDYPISFWEMTCVSHHKRDP